MHRFGVRTTVALLALAWALAVPSGARAAEKARVGIAWTLRVNVAEEQAHRLGQAMGQALTEELGVDTIAGAEAARRLPPGGLPEDCLAEPACRQDVGDRLDASELLLFVVVQLGDETQVEATWVDLEGGDVVSRPRVTLGPEDVARDVFASAAARLLPHHERAAPTPAPLVVQQVPAASPATPGRAVPLGTWVAGGVALASAVGGTLFALSARNKFNALEGDDCRERVCDQGRLDGLDRSALIADLLWATAVTASATAAVLYVLGDDASEEGAGTGLSLAAGPGGASISFGGAF